MVLSAFGDLIFLDTIALRETLASNGKTGLERAFRRTSAGKNQFKEMAVKISGATQKPPKGE